MRFHLGPKKNYGEWHSWFAWRPVPLYRYGYGHSREWVWLQRIERRGTCLGWVWEYRV